MNELKGLGVAMVTPFKQNKEIDFVALEKLTSKLIDGGLDYLVVMGTTGESATLSKEEKQAVLNAVLKTNNGRLPIVFGIGGNDTIKMVNEYKSFDLSGVSAILSASPYYNKPSQEGIFQHYKYLSENMSHPIILYNVPGRTASNMTAETTLRIANEFQNVIGIKEASGNMEQVMQILNNVTHPLRRFCGCSKDQRQRSRRKKRQAKESKPEISISSFSPMPARVRNHDSNAIVGVFDDMFNDSDDGLIDY